MTDAATITIGGVTALSVQMVIMAQLRRLTRAGSRADRLFDWLNYPVAFALVTLADPPWPVWSWAEWQQWGMLGLALATLASVTAKKTGDAKPRGLLNGGDT
jgi:hypothetical protein